MRYLICCLLLLAGCQNPFFKSTDGTATQIGLSLPANESIQIQAISYLNGQSIYVKDIANIKYKFTSSQSNEYFGVIRTVNFRTSDLVINPTNSYSIKQ